MFVLANLIQALAVVIDYLLWAYLWIIIARAILSWVNPDPYNPIVRFLYSATEPVLYRIRRAVPLYTGGYRSARQEEALHLLDKAHADSDRTRQQIALQTRAVWLGLTVGTGRIGALSEALRASGPYWKVV